MRLVLDTDQRSFREQTINVKKNIAFQSGERRFLPTMDAVSIASDTSFGGYCSQKVRHPLIPPRSSPDLTPFSKLLCSVQPPASRRT
jgi:hypothetical protein